MDLQQVNETTWYRGQASPDHKLDYQFVGKGHDQEGPGFYFSDSKEDAERYGKALLSGHVRVRKLASGTNPANPETIRQLILMAPDSHNTLLDWAEDPQKGLQIAMDAAIQQGSEKDSFQQVWYDFYLHEPAQYLKNLVQLGYDGHLATWTKGVQHLILYNPEAFHETDAVSADIVEDFPIEQWGRWDYNVTDRLKEINTAAKKSSPKYPSEDDIEDAWSVVRFVFGMEDGDDYDQTDFEKLYADWMEALDRAKMERWPVQEAAKKFNVADHGRRIKGKSLQNPIIVARIGNDYAVLDGSHRLITKFENNEEYVDALIVPMDWADDVLALDSQTLAKIGQATEFKFKWKKEEIDGGNGFEIHVTDARTGDPVGHIAVNQEYLGDDADEVPYFFEPYQNEPFYEKLVEHPYVTDITSLSVDRDYQRQGVAKYIYNLALKEIKKRYPDDPIFINASPLGGDIELDDLIRFYQKAGFEVLKKYGQHRNAALWLDDPSKIKMVSQITARTNSTELQNLTWKDFKSYWSMNEIIEKDNAWDEFRDKIDDPETDQHYQNIFEARKAELMDLDWPLKVYRGLPKKSDHPHMGDNQFGVHWSVDPKLAQRFARPNGTVWETEVTPDQIEWYHTILTRMPSDFYEQENELTLESGQEIEIKPYSGEGEVKRVTTVIKTKPYQDEYPVYEFEKEVSSDIQISDKGSEWRLKEMGQYRSGHAYGNLPMRAKLYLERYGVPDWIYSIVSIYPKRGTVHAVYVQKGKNLIKLWDRGNTLAEFPWKAFEAQAHARGYRIKGMHKGVIEDSNGYWLNDPEFKKPVTSGKVETQNIQSIEVYRGVTDVWPDQINPTHKGDGVFGPGTYFALDYNTAEGFALGEFESYEHFGVVCTYKVPVKNVVTLSEDMYEGIESAMDLTLQPGITSPLPSKIKANRLTKVAGKKGFNALILKQSSEGSMPEGNEQYILTPTSKIKPILISFSIYGDSSILKNLGVRVEHGTHTEQIPAKEIKKISERLRKTIPNKTASDFEDEGFVGDYWGSHGSGIMFLHQNKVLLLKRASWVEQPGTWGIPGGAIPVDESGKPMEALKSAMKEAEEEIGDLHTFKQFDKVVYRDGDFTYTTFLAESATEFTPTLNDESVDYVWADLNDLPKPLHFGVQYVLDNSDILKRKPITAKSNPLLEEEMDFTDWLEYHDPISEGMVQTEEQAKAFFNHRQLTVNKLARQIGTKNLILYRALGFNTPAEKNSFLQNLKAKKYAEGFKGVGIFWSLYIDKADTYEGPSTHKIIMVAKVPQSSVDWETTYMRLMDPLYAEDEEEIRLYPGKPLEITRVLDGNGKEIWKPESAHRMKSGFYFWEPSEDLYTESPQQDWQQNQRTMPQEPTTDWPGIALSKKESKVPEVLKRYIRGEDSAPELKDLKKYQQLILPELKKLYPSGYVALYRGFADYAEPHELGEIFQDPKALVSFTESKSTALAIAKERSEDYPEQTGYAIKIEVPISAIYFHWKLDPIGREYSKEKEVLILPYGHEWKVIKTFTKNESVTASKTYTADEVMDLWGADQNFKDVAKKFRESGDTMNSPVPKLVDQYAEYQETWVDPQDIAPNDVKSWSEPMPSREEEQYAQEYAKSPAEDFPPIILHPNKAGKEKWKVINGRHRTRAAVIRGGKVKALIPTKNLKATSGIKDLDYPYFHVSNHPELPSIHEGTTRAIKDPYGIYLFLKGESVQINEWNDKKYRWDAKLKPNARILKFSTLNPKKSWALLNEAGIKTPMDAVNALEQSSDFGDEIEYDYFCDNFIEDSDPDSEQYTEEEINTAWKKYWDLHQSRYAFYRILRGHFNDRKKLTEFFSKRYDVLWDDTHAIYAGEPQLVVLNPEVIAWGPREENVPDEDIYKLHGESVDTDVEEVTASASSFLTAVEKKIKSKAFKKAIEEDFEHEYSSVEFDDFYEERSRWVLKDLKRRLKFKNGDLLLHRAYGFKSPKEWAYTGLLKSLETGEQLRGLGEHWSYDEDAAYPWSGDNTFIVTLTARVPASSVDLVTTLHRLFDRGWGDTELEIEVETNKPVYPLVLKERNGKIIWKAKTAQQMVATPNQKDFLEQAWTEYKTKYNAGDYVGFFPPKESMIREANQNWQPILDGSGYIYRAISLPEKNLDLNRPVGIFWTWNPDRAHVYWGDLSEDQWIAVLTARVTPDAVDWLGTIEQEMSHQYSGEDEIRLKEGAAVELQEIEWIAPKDQNFRSEIENKKIKLTAAQHTTAEKVFEASDAEPYRYVWRVENQDGQGPYNAEVAEDLGGGSLQDYWTDREHNSTTHPSPLHDEGFDELDLENIYGEGYGSRLFGFESIQQLKKWFNDKELKQLKELGFDVVKRKASDIWSSGRQVFFKPLDDYRQIVNASTESEFQRIARWYLDNVFKCPDMPMPDFRITTRMDGTLGRARMQYDWDRPIVEIHQRVLDNPESLERVIAHELIHVWQYTCVPEVQEYFKVAHETGGRVTRDVAQRLKRIMNEYAGHGDNFHQWADRINKLKGPGFVTEKSDETLKTARNTKPFYIFLEKWDDGRIAYGVFVRPSPQIRQEMERRSEDRETKLFQTTDERFLQPTRLGPFGKGRFIPKDPEAIKILQDLWKNGKVVTANETNDHVSSSQASVWYHLTDNEKFKLDPQYAPEDNAIAIEDRSGRPGIYLTPNVETWVNGHGYWRPFVVEFKVDPSIKNEPGVHGRYGGEMFVPAASFDKLSIERIIPLDAYAREEFGSYGWIEESLQEEFDTGNPINTKEIYPFRSYRYSGPDVRDMSAEEVTKLKRQLKKVKGSVTVTAGRFKELDIERQEAEEKQMISKVSRDGRTATLYRTVSTYKFNEIDPMYQGSGVFGDGTYFAITPKDTEPYMAIEHSDWNWLFRYEFNFNKPLVIKSPEDINLQYGGSIETINTDTLQDQIGLNHLHTNDLGEVARESGFDAVIMQGRVDGGPQVLIPAKTKPSYRITGISFITRDQNLVNDIAKTTGAVYTPMNVFGDVIFKNLNQTQIAAIDEILDRYEDLRLGNEITAAQKEIVLAAPEFETLKKNKKALTEEERQKVMDAGAVWHHGPGGAESPAVWKATVRGKDWYVSHTHRAYRVSPTLKGAIKEFDFIRTTAATKVDSALEFKSSPMLWNGRTKIDKGVTDRDKVYVATKGLKDFILTYLNIPDEDLLKQIQDAKTDQDIPEDFFRRNADLIYFDGLEFTTYRLTEYLQPTILKVLLASRSGSTLPEKFKIIMFSPDRDKEYLVKDLLQKGEKLIESHTVGGSESIEIYMAEDLPPDVTVPLQHSPEHLWLNYKKPDDPEWKDKDLNYRLYKAQDIWYAVHNGQVVGHFGLNSDGYVETVFVDEEYRGKRIAENLYLEALKIMDVIYSDPYAQEPGGRALWKRFKELYPDQVELTKNKYTFYSEPQNFNEDNEPMTSSLSEWAITVPKTIPWSEYEKELKAVEDWSQEMNFKVPPHFKAAKAGDRCYVVHDGEVKGWMEITGLEKFDKPWRCSTTGQTWQPGTYLKRSGPFHPVKDMKMKGFQGIRRFIKKE